MSRRPRIVPLLLRRSSRLLAPLVVALAMVAGLVVDAPAAFAARWSAPAAIPAAETDGGSPALVSYDGSLYAFWEGQSSPYHIYYSSFSGTTWSPETTVPSALTNYLTGPAVAVYNDELYVAWEGQSSPYGLFYSAFDGTGWSAQAEVPSALTVLSSTPGLTAYNGDLFVSWVGQSSQSIFYSAFDGSSWTSQVTIPSASSDDCQGCDTTLAAYGGELYAGWLSAFQQITFASFAGSTWSSPRSLGHPYDVRAGPSFAVKGKDLYVASMNGTMRHEASVQTASFNGAKWSGSRIVKGAFVIPVGGPTIASLGNSLFIAWDAETGKLIPIEYSSKR